MIAGFLGRGLTATVLAVFLMAQPLVVCGVACLTGHRTPHGMASSEPHDSGHDDAGTMLPCDPGSVSTPDHGAGQPMGTALLVPIVVVPVIRDSAIPIVVGMANPGLSYSPDIHDPPPRFAARS